jgi:membrane protease YdiL (CAAX protease family)
MKNKLQSSPCFLQFAFVVAGFIEVMVVSMIFKNKVYNTLAAFVLLSISGLLVFNYFGFKTDVKHYWSPRKIWYLIIGIIAGFIIQIIPYSCLDRHQVGLLFKSNALQFLSISSVTLTLLIVMWEELWFRNPILNLAQGVNKQVLLSIFTGFLFTALHLLNPKINMLKEGPELLLAGTCLTLAYYASKSFYLPLGMHFGNNLLSSIIDHVSESTLNKQDINGSFTGIAIKVITLLILAFVLIIWLKAGKQKPNMEPEPFGIN